MLKHTFAAVAAGAGIAAAVVQSNYPPGLHAGRPLAMLGSVFGNGSFWATLLLSTGVIGLCLIAAGGSRSPRFAGATILATSEPVLWGLSLPLLSVVFDPWFFHTTAPVLVVAGTVLGLLGAVRRVPQTGSGTDLGLGLAAIIVLAVLVPAFLVLSGPPRFHSISGDEPHYLVIARSLWVDGDVEVGNEYDEGLMSPFWSGALAVHAKPGANPAARYSIHGPGLAVWLAPWYGAGRGLSATAFTVMVRIAMSLWLAAGAGCLFLLIRDLSSPVVALRGTALAVFTLPLLFAGPHLFPAVPVFTLSCAAYVLLRNGPGFAQNLVTGVLLAALPWLHFKFFGLMAAVALVGIAGQWKRGAEGRTHANIAALIAPLVLTTMGHLAFTWSLYERLSPLAIGVGADPTLRAPAGGEDWVAYLSDPGGALRTGIGYLMDQREGLLFYAPQYLLAVAGCAWMFRRRRADAWALTLVFLSLVAPYALSQNIGHWGAPACPLTGALWTLAVPMANGLTLPAGGGPSAKRRRALRGGLVGWGVGATVLLLAQADLLYHDFNVPRSLVLLRYGAPGLPLAEAAPAWLGPDGLRLVPSALWLALTATAGVFLWQ